MSTTNPLLKPFTNKDQATPFDLIKVEHYLPAVDEAVKVAKENIAKIKATTAAPTFENTILALEAASELAERVSGIYGNMEVAHADEALQALAKDIYPKMSALSSDVSLDAEIFQRVKTVYDQRASMNLNAEQTRLLEKTYLGFTRNGALLSAADKEKMRAIDQELSVLGPKFSENVLKATNAFEMFLDNKDDVAGLPEGVLEGAAAMAEAKGQKGKWLFTLSIPSYLPFLTYAKNRTLREKMWRAYAGRAYKGEFDQMGAWDDSLSHDDRYALTEEWTGLMVRGRSLDPKHPMLDFPAPRGEDVRDNATGPENETDYGDTNPAPDLDDLGANN